MDVIALLCYSNSLGPGTFDTWLYGHRRHLCGLWPVGQAELQSDPLKKSIRAESQKIHTYYFWWLQFFNLFLFFTKPIFHLLSNLLYQRKGERLRRPINHPVNCIFLLIFDCKFLITRSPIICHLCLAVFLICTVRQNTG